MTPSPGPFTPTGFPETCWSLVLRADLTLEGRNAALDELGRRYWYPVYAYLRQCGHDPDMAQGIARAFFGDLLQHAAAPRVDYPGKRFRDFLLQRLEAFLAADWRRLPEAELDGPAPELAGLERRYGLDNPPDITATEAFQRGFAAEVMARAQARLREEAVQGGHLGMYEALLPHLVREPSSNELASIATQLGQRPLVLIVALKRLRQRFRELAGSELADTVGSHADLFDEQKTLHGFLRRS